MAAIKQAFNVLGVKRFKGDVEGKQYDNTKLIVVMDTSERSGNAMGMDATEMPYGDSSNFDKFQGMKFPCQLELTVNLTTKGYEVVGHSAAAVPRAA